MVARMTCSMNRTQTIAATMAPIVFLVRAPRATPIGRRDHGARVERADSGRQVVDPVRRQGQHDGGEPESEQHGAEYRAQPGDHRYLDREDAAVTEERLRIARELHDVIAHSMSVIAVQSAVGNHVIDTQPAEARQALAAIEATSRSALTEMRRLLGVLRQEGESRGSLVPRCRRLGSSLAARLGVLPLCAASSGHPRPVPVTVERRRGQRRPRRADGIRPVALASLDSTSWTARRGHLILPRTST